MGEATLFTGVDRAAFAVGFADRLRRAGVDVSFAGAERFAAGLEAVGPLSVDDLYWLSRLSFVTGQGQLGTFDEVFDAVFGRRAGQVPTKRRGQQRSVPSPEDEQLRALPLAEPSATSGAEGLPWATVPSIAFDDSDESDEGSDDAVLHERRPSPVDNDMDRPFDSLDDRELERVGALIESAMTRWPHRRSRRQRATRSRGRVALRRSIQRSMRTGGDVVTLLHTRPRRRPRPVVVVVDVSGSMESYARAYLHLGRALAVGRRAEVFVFATRLSRITPSIRARSPAEAIDRVTAAVGDRFSGTRLGSSLRTLLHHRVWNTAVRGAVVVICSDGWDADDPEQLERTMRRLSLIAHRVVWINPRAAAEGFEPRTGGMAAALPFCDHFLPGDTARSMQDVLDAITAA
jgi:uncharacterized protein with von Willebrand factor type A (vWA) domain